MKPNWEKHVNQSDREIEKARIKTKEEKMEIEWSLEKEKKRKSLIEPRKPLSWGDIKKYFSHHDCRYEYVGFTNLFYIFLFFIFPFFVSLYLISVPFHIFCYWYIITVSVLLSQYSLVP